MAPAERLRELMRASLVSGADSARKMGITYQQWSSLKRGVTRNPGIQVVGRILHALGLKWSAIDPPE